MENSSCYKCEKIFDEEDDVAECDGCCSLFHPRCIKVRRSDMSARQHCKNLKLYCTECCDNPEQINAENIKTILKFIVKIDMFNQKGMILQQQRDDLLNNLSNKINAIESQNAELKKSLESFNDKIKEPIQTKTKSFANVVKSTSVKPTVLVKPKEKQISKKTLNDVTANIDVNQFKICGTRNVRNGGLILRCDSSTETMKIKQAIQEKIGDSYEIELPKIKKPRLRISNIDDEIKKEAIIGELKRHNQQIKDDNIDLITTINKSYRGFTSIDIIIEVECNTYKKLLEIGTLYLPWRECKVFEHIHIKRCYKCCGYSHISSECNGQQTCSKCSGPHKYAECNSKKIQCVNCISTNNKYKSNLSTNHNAWSKECNIHQKRIANLRNKIEYDNNK